MVEKENRCQNDSINNNNNGSRSTSAPTSKQNKRNDNDEMDEKYEIRAQMFKMRAIMWCFHSSLHANLLYDLFASKYLFTLAAVATDAIAATLFPPVFIIIVSHWIFHLSHRIRIFVMSSFFAAVSLCTVCARQAQFSYNVFHIPYDYGYAACECDRAWFYAKNTVFVSHSVIDTCILNTKAHTRNNGNPSAHNVSCHIQAWR